MDSTTSDSLLVFYSVLSSSAIYIVLTLISPSGSKVPLLASVFIFSNMISRTARFQGLVRRAIQWSERRTMQRQRQKQRDSSAKLAGETDGNTRFHALAQGSQKELLEALVSLRDYAKNCKGTNERRRKLYKLMSWRQQKLCDEAGYSQKLKKIDIHVGKNQEIFDAIKATTENIYDIDQSHYNTANYVNSRSQNTSSSNYWVVESLGHFVRDWTSEGEQEIASMLHYITSQLDKLVSPENAHKTCVVIPGSGLGRIAHEVAKHRNYGAVHAVEFSGLMHTLNQFVYEPSCTVSRKFYPYVHKTSNYLTTDAQFREASLSKGVVRPDNLHLHLDDFRYFSIPEKHKYDTVVVVSAFFIDTAENIMDYFDQINQLTAPSKKSSVKNGYWINFGPLKYGSAAQAELNASEIKHIRKAMGWIDSHTLNTIEDPNAEYSRTPLAGTGLSGYITDSHSLWQGYYGISMWTSGHKSNQGR